MWEYLQTKQLDARFLLVAGYLWDKVAGKNLVDLDCGSARLLKYLPDTWASYFGNDIDEGFFPKHSRAVFRAISDDQVLQELEEKPCDILLVFGHGADSKGNNVHESKTLSKSIIEIVKVKQPEIIVLEIWWRFERDHSVLRNLITNIQEIGEYRAEWLVKLNAVFTNKWLHERLIIILEKEGNKK